MSKPLTGAILGILIGVATAIFLARQGIWPPDQLTLFFLPGILGLFGLLLLSMGRPSRGVFTLVVALLLLVPMLVWGALGFGDLDQQGQLNGGCEVSAQSSVDSTNVTDTSAGDPFLIDPDGGLTWQASSPTVFEDYEWEIYVVIGGIPVTVDSGTEANDDADQENDGEIPDIRAYADSRGINIDIYRGVYEVGGSAATCDGLGFVEIEGEGLDPIALISLIAAITLLVILIVLAFIGRKPASEVAAEGTGPSDEVAPDDTPGPAADIAAGAVTAGYARDMFDDEGEYVDPKLAQEDYNELEKAGEEVAFDQEPPPPPSLEEKSEPAAESEESGPEPIEEDDDDNKLPGLDD